MTTSMRFMLALAALALLAPTASAHASQTTADGKYRITWGLLDEPAYTHQKNRLDLIVREVATGAGVPGIETSGLHLELKHGEEEYGFGNVTVYRGAKSSAFAGPGNYTGSKAIYLTKPGIYTLHVKGNINGSEVDVEIPAAHEYGEMRAIMFPEEVALGSQTDTSALEARLAALEQEVATLKAQARTQSETPATLTPQAPPAQSPVPAAGVLAVLAVLGFAALRRRG